jgi:hypothetical protein
MQAVWMVRSRQILSRFRFFLAIFGYDRNDRSLTHKIYLVYAAVFYTLWSFAVLSLLAGATARILEDIGRLGGQPNGTPISVPQMAVGISTLGLLIWFILAAYRASRRSPIIFSEEDAYLVCQTPADRRAVALSWLAGQWPPGAAPIWAIAVTLGFALVEASSQGNLNGADIPRYVLAGFRSLSIVVFLQFGMLAIIWALGILRLQKDRVRTKLFIAPLAVAALLAVAWFSSGWSGFIPSTTPGWAVILKPVQIPFQAGYGFISWGLGMLLSLGWTAIGLLILSLAAVELNLSRAAQESRGLSAQGWDVISEPSRKVQPLDKGDIQGAEHPPSPWFNRLNWKGRGKAQILVLKDLVQSSRLGWWTRLRRWIGLYLVGLGVLVIPVLPGSDWAAGALALVYWALLVAQQSTQSLKIDLAKWWLFRQLPLSAREALVGDLNVPWALVVLINWASLFTADSLRFIGVPAIFGANSILFLGLALLVIVLVRCIGLIGTLDILRQAKNSLLLAGESPQVGTFSLFIGGGIALVVALLVSQLAWLGMLLALGLSAAAAWLILRLAARRLQRI